MIRAAFLKGRGGLVSAKVSGHAGFAPGGEDIVCAGVSSAVMMAANGITEILGVAARVLVSEAETVIELDDPPDFPASAFLRALYLHIDLLRQQYPDNITITLSEV
ncbi:MAG: ribosomal-processing cysteine protease Prp [Oscillospiraceae bacterium]|jgi:uncharacterized protein YsxB (DUF464 family)|nr:ribosomal-processing cysteine protease Prp [Oscillospiraceae bacterium]